MSETNSHISDIAKGSLAVSAYNFFNFYWSAFFGAFSRWYRIF
jgi:hypothetical protein